MNKKIKTADISSVIKQLQDEVDMVVTIDGSGEVGTEIDISKLDFDKLKLAFSKSKLKNQVVFDLQKAVEAKANKMLQQNPLRMNFYKEYQRIIEEYNNGKDEQAVEKAFISTQDFMQKLSLEESRAFSEGLDEETLAIFDLLKKTTLTTEEVEQVKKVAKETLKRLKQEVLMFNRWRESSQLIHRAIVIIRHDVKYLPAEPYPNNDLPTQESLIYQHIHKSYQGGNISLYN